MITGKEFESFLGAHERLVFSICLSFTGNRFDAEDLAQETFLSAYRAFDRFDGRNPNGWLASIAANKCRDYLSRAERRNVPLMPEDEELVADARGSPEDELLFADGEERVHRLCMRLKEPYRSAAICYFVKDEKPSETAMRTGVGLRTLETQLYRAKKLLKTLWEEENP